MSYNIYIDCQCNNSQFYVFSDSIQMCPVCGRSIEISDDTKRKELIKLLNQKINFIEKYLHNTSYSEEDFKILLSYKQFDICKQFRADNNCDGCPIQEYTGKPHCENTPYTKLINITDQILQIQNNIDDFDSRSIQHLKLSLLHELTQLETQFNHTLNDFYGFLTFKIYSFITTGKKETD